MFVFLARYDRIQTLGKASLHFASANKSQILVLDFNLQSMKVFHYYFKLLYA